MSGGFSSGFSQGFGGTTLVTGGWDSLQAVIDGRLKPQDRVDCPVCGEVLETNGKVWNCPRWGAKHYRSPNLPKD
jgi:hypothetical protein